MNRNPPRRRMAVAVALCAALATLLAPAGASAFSKAIWGPVTVNGVSQFPMYHTLGVTIFEEKLQWNVVAPTRPANPTNPTDPAYQWPAEVAQAIAQASLFHMRVLLQITDAPSWANGGHSNPAWAPTNPQDFANFAVAAAREYPTVHLWMVWGEPTRAGNWYPMRKATPGATLRGAQLTAPHLYARILDATYGALKHLSNTNLIIGGSTYTTGLVDALQWIANLKLPDGKPPRMDMYSHNPFSYKRPSFSVKYSPFDEVQFSDLHELAGWVDHYLRKGMPLFLSEFTIPTQQDQEFNFYVDPNVAAKWVTDALRLCRSWSQIYALGWVNVYDNPPLSYGGLLTVSGQPKPDYYAFENG